jgi:hypothetical protein
LRGRHGSGVGDNWLHFALVGGDSFQFEQELFFEIRFLGVYGVLINRIRVVVETQIAYRDYFNDLLILAAKLVLQFIRYCAFPPEITFLLHTVITVPDRTIGTEFVEAWHTDAFFHTVDFLANSQSQISTTYYFINGNIRLIYIYYLFLRNYSFLGTQIYSFAEIK